MSKTQNTISSTEANLSEAQLTVAKTEDKLFNYMEKNTRQNRVIAILFVAFLINLVLTISIAGAFVVMNDTSSQSAFENQVVVQELASKNAELESTVASNDEFIQAVKTAVADQYVPQMTDNSEEVMYTSPDVEDVSMAAPTDMKFSN